MSRRWSLLVGAGWLSLLVPQSCVLDRNGTLGPGGGGGSAGSGGGSACVTGDDCPPPSADCRQPLCAQSSCDEAFAPVGQECQGDKMCNHLGECVAAQGAACAYGEDCYSGVCEDGFCCDSLCDDLCEACDVEGSEGTCTLVASGVDLAQECALYCDGLGQCVRGDYVWSHTYGGTYDDFPRAIAVDSEGSVIFAVEVESPVDFGGDLLVPEQSYDVALVKLDASGAHAHSQLFYGWDGQYVGALAITPDDEVVVAGRFFDEIDIDGDLHDAPCCSSDLWVAKIDSAGGVVWSKAFGGGGSVDVYGLAVDAAGDIYLGGYHDGQLDLGATELGTGSDQDGFVIKLYEDGSYAWAMGLGDGANQVVSGLAIDAAGDLLVTGYYDGSILDLPSLPTATGTDIFVAKLTSDTHVVVWSRAYGGAGVQRPFDLASAPEGGLVIAGGYDGELVFDAAPLPNAGASDIFVARLDAQGEPLWGRGFGGGDEDFAASVAVDAAGNVVLVGGVGTGVSFGGGTLPVADPWDAFVAKLGPDGDSYWSHGHGGTYDDVTTVVANHPDGGVVAAGYFEWSIDFGMGTHDSAIPGWPDVFVVRLTP